MYERNLYWEKILPFIDRPVIKVITGMRRIGKSCILKMIIAKLDREHGAGRYIEIQVYALSFQEFIDFSAERHQPIDRLFQEYLKYGGFPGIHHFDLSESVIYQYIGAIYNTILLKDVIKRNQVRNIRLLENLARYIFDNIGQSVRYQWNINHLHHPAGESGGG